MKPNNLKPALDLVTEVNELKHLFSLETVGFRDFPTNMLCDILNSEENEENSVLITLLNDMWGNRLDKLKELGVEV